MSEHIFVIICSQQIEWEDLRIFLNENEAIEYTKRYPYIRAVIFEKSDNGYIPTYVYYKNGIKYT